MRGAQAAGLANKLKRTPHRTSVSLQERLTFFELILAYAAQGADESAGDPDNGIAPGTKWEDLPDDFVCPLCGVGKDQFEEG